MFNIKLEEDNVVIKFSLNNGNYDQKNNYKIDLTNKKYYLMEAGEWTELEWELAVESIEDRMDDIKHDVKEKILNNKRVIYSYEVAEERTGKDHTKEKEKAQRHMDKNLLIQDFLNNYTL
jgi:archaellum biogenesis ATPase FlaH